MPQTADLSPRARIAFGGIFVLAGLMIVLVGFGILRPDPRDIHAPLWVIGCAGFAFMLAGASVAIGALSKETQADGSLPASAPLPLRILQYLMGLGIVSTLAMIGSWVAIGSDGKFRSSASFFGVTVSGLSSEMLGRMMFGLGAGLCWLMLIMAARQGWRKLFPAQAQGKTQPEPR
jgi:hypothetical protein